MGVISSQSGRFMTLPLDYLNLGRLLLLGNYTILAFYYSHFGNIILLDFTLSLSNERNESFCTFDLDYT